MFVYAVHIVTESDRAGDMPTNTITLLADFLMREPFAFVASALGMLTPVFLVAILRYRWLLNRSLQANRRLKREIENREKLLEKGRTFNKEVQARLPVTVGKSIERSRIEGDEAGAERVWEEWLTLEGASLARLLMDRAKVCYVRAITEDRTAFLTAAEGLALSAVSLHPTLAEGLAWAGELAATRKLEGRTVIPPADALAALRRPSVPPSAPADLAWAGEALEREAVQQYDAGRFHLALCAVEAALRVHRLADGENALSVLNTQSLQSYILLGLGRADQALPIVRAAAETLASHPDFGPDHPDTLSFGFQLALVLESFGSRQEALAVACAVLERQTAHPALGPNHPDSTETRKLVHRLQDDAY